MEAPDYFHSGFYRSGGQQPAPEKYHPNDFKQEPFVVEEFFDFSNDVTMADIKPPTASHDDYNAGGGVNSAESSAVDSCNSNSFSEPTHALGEIGPRSLLDQSSTGELCVPHDDLAELEWLSTLQEESFSSEDMEKLQLISGMVARPDIEPGAEPKQLNSIFRSETPVPGKARSKRSRAAPGNWASHLLVPSPTTSTNSENDHLGKPVKTVMRKKDGPDRRAPSDGRKCLHCAADKTPQWRTGPMGPKTLCNACGVRYKSGRLVPEYRPAASPTFVLTKHSNSHRKVLELRRQKEMHHRQPRHLHDQHHHHHQQHFLEHLHHQSMIFDVFNGEDYLIHQHTEPDYRQLI